MQRGGFSGKFISATLAVALCASSTMATAAAAPMVRPISPLVAVSVYGTQASAQAVCANGASAAAAAGAAAAAQGQAGCVLPAVDAAAPPPVVEGVPPPPPGGDFGINWVLAGLGALILLGAIIAATSEDEDETGEPLSPV